MRFQDFNNSNNYFNETNVKPKSFGEGVSAYFKSKENVRVYQAYVRAIGSQAVENAVKDLWAKASPEPVVPVGGGGPSRPTAAARPNLLTDLYRAVDTYFSGTITPGGTAKLDSEKSTRQLHWSTTGAGKDEMPSLDEYFKYGIPAQHLDRHLITPGHLRDYLDLLSTVIQPYLNAGIVERHNENHRQAVKTRDAISSLKSQIASLTLEDGSYNKHDPKWKAVEALAEYWRKELPNVAARRPIWNEIMSYAGTGSGVSLYRLVSQGERDFVMNQSPKILAQGPSSFERHKWFFNKAGSPGVGHGVRLEIKLKGDGWKFLFDRAQEVNDGSKSTSPIALAKKSNEPGCIGIHEELLEAFCMKMVLDIKVV